VSDHTVVYAVLPHLEFLCFFGSKVIEVL